MDTDKLIKALDEDNNEILLNYTNKKIKEMNLRILKELELPKDILLTYMKQLDGYMYIDEISQLRMGAFVRWIPISDFTSNEFPLNRGALVCDVKMTDQGVNVVLKSFTHTYFQIPFDENLLFQKLSDQQRVLLSALDALAA